jgi:hypothetical protein
MINYPHLLFGPGARGSTDSGRLGPKETKAKATMNKYTHDLDGNLVDGFYWLLLEDKFRDAVEIFRREGKNGAVALAWRLVTTTDDVPAELVQHQQDFWNIAAETDEPWSNAAIWKLPGDTWDEMIAEIGRGEYAPSDATVFITKFIGRVTEAQGAGWWLQGQTAEAEGGKPE